MLTYASAITVAATLNITLMSTIMDSTSDEYLLTPSWQQANHHETTRIVDSQISISDSKPTYFLSNLEQSALRRALLRSVQIVSK